MFCSIFFVFSTIYRENDLATREKKRENSEENNMLMNERIVIFLRSAVFLLNESFLLNKKLTCLIKMISVTLRIPMHIRLIVAIDCDVLKRKAKSIRRKREKEKKTSRKRTKENYKFIDSSFLVIIFQYSS